jgi:hypothetical protein
VSLSLTGKNCNLPISQQFNLAKAPGLRTRSQP